MRYSAEELKLVYPSKEYEHQVMRYREIFLQENESFDGCAGLEDVESFNEWIDFDNRLSKKYGESYVPSSVFLGIRIADNKVVGIIDIRHSLSDFLYEFGGHIGYSVLPEERRKGYAKEMLRLALLECKNIGIKRALLSCDKENIASSKTIKANGGILEKEALDRRELTKEEFENAYKEAENLMNILETKKEKVKAFTDKYFKIMIGET